MKRIFSAMRRFPRMFQGFVSLSGLQGTEFAPFLTEAFKSADFPTLLNALFKGALSIGAILAVLQLARAGFLYMTSDVWGDKAKATKMIQDATVGLLLLIGIWLILNQINPKLLELNILQRMKPPQDSSVQNGLINSPELRGTESLDQFNRTRQEQDAEQQRENERFLNDSPYNVVQ